MCNSATSLAQQAILKEFTDWKHALPDGHAFKQYKRIQLPAFNSRYRPGDRAVALVASASDNEGSVSFEAAPIYRVSRVVDPDTKHWTGEWYSDGDYSNSGRALVDMLSRFNEVSHTGDNALTQ